MGNKHQKKNGGAAVMNVIGKHPNVFPIVCQLTLLFFFSPISPLCEGGGKKSSTGEIAYRDFLSFSPFPPTSSARGKEEKMG